MNPNFRSRLVSVGGGLALLLVASAPHAFATGRAPQPSAFTPSSGVCDAAVQHPIQVKVEALDPIRRGQAVRLRVTSQARVPMAGVEARLVSTGGATVVGRARATLGRLTPGREARTEFAVRVPAEGHRFLVEFQVEGEGTAGRIARGAAYNLLPDGPAETPRLVTTADGRQIAEVPARRIP